MSWRIEGTDILGAPIGFQTAKTIVKRFERGYKALKREDYVDAFFSATPDFLLNPYKAIMAEQGTGIEGKPPIKYTPGEAAWKAMGFTPTRESETWRAQEISRDKRQQRLDKIEYFAEKLVQANKKLDTKAQQELRKDVKEYTEKEQKKGDSGVIFGWGDVVESAKRRTDIREKGYDERLPKYMRKYQDVVRESFGLPQADAASSLIGKIMVAKNEFDALLETDRKQAFAYRKENYFDISMAEQAQNVASQLSDLRKRRDKIMLRENLTPERKKELIDNYNKKIAMIAERFVNIYNKRKAK